MGDESDVCVYDSAEPYTCQSPLLHQLTEQLRQLYSNPTLPDPQGLRVKFCEVDVQRDGVSCGVHSIANATALGHGRSPVRFEYAHSRMRQHLHDCFVARKLSLFPGVESSSNAAAGAGDGDGDSDCEAYVGDDEEDDNNGGGGDGL